MADSLADFPTIADLPEVDTASMIEVDRLMVQEFRISLVQMMENAGRCLAMLTRERHLGGSARGARVAVLAGGGGNGGGGLTAARRLAAWGAEVAIALAQAPDDMAEIPRLQLDIVRGFSNARLMDDGDENDRFDVIVDGLIGYSLSGAPRGRHADLIGWANAQPASIVALDVPSGFDAATGQVSQPVIRAASTLTIALPKRGLTDPGNANYVGALYCADIGVPPELYRLLCPPLDLPAIFSESDIVRVGLAARRARQE